MAATLFTAILQCIPSLRRFATATIYYCGRYRPTSLVWTDER